MLKALINKPQFEYDIHSLIKAFYPGEDVKVWCEETVAPKKEENGENSGCLEKQRSYSLTLKKTGLGCGLGRRKRKWGSG